MPHRLTLAAALALALTACFDPEQPDGAVECSESGACPPDFRCHEPDRRCYRDPPGDPDDVDATPATGDGSPPVDGAPGLDASVDSSIPDMPACSDGLDNDCDGLIDGPDPGCVDADDDDEHGDTECDNGDDDDGDGKTDFQTSADCGRTSDPGCADPADDNELPVND